MAKAQAMFLKGLKEERRDESKVRAVHGKLQVSFMAEGELAAKHTGEGEGHANEGWFIDKYVVLRICTDFNDVFFETVVKSS